MKSFNVDRYIIKDELGHGGCATVYRAYDPNLDRHVALKMLRVDGFNYDQTAVTRFIHEAKSASSLEHPRIVPIYDSGDYQGQQYIVMRLMSGGSLRNRLKPSGLDPTFIVKTITDIASALDEVHRKKIVHRDLKPDNVLYDRQGNAYLADFGIAKLSNVSSSVTGFGFVGTLPYMSPEQLDPGQKVDGRADIYSLGIIFLKWWRGVYHILRRMFLKSCICICIRPFQYYQNIDVMFQKPAIRSYSKRLQKIKNPAFLEQVKWPLRSSERFLIPLKKISTATK